MTRSRSRRLPMVCPRQRPFRGHAVADRDDEIAERGHRRGEIVADDPGELAEHADALRDGDDDEEIDDPREAAHDRAGELDRKR